MFEGGTFNISITSGDNQYLNVESVTVPYPGYYTVDLSSKNIIAEGDNMKVTISQKQQDDYIKGLEDNSNVVKVRFRVSHKTLYISVTLLSSLIDNPLIDNSFK